MADKIVKGFTRDQTLDKPQVNFFLYFSSLSLTRPIGLPPHTPVELIRQKMVPFYIKLRIKGW